MIPTRNDESPVKYLIVPLRREDHAAFDELARRAGVKRKELAGQVLVDYLYGQARLKPAPPSPPPRT